MRQWDRLGALVLGLFVRAPAAAQSETERREEACGDQPVVACVERLRTELRAGLARLPEDPRTHGPCSNEGKSFCARSEPGCMPQAGEPLESLVLLGREAAAAAPELLRAFQEGNPPLRRLALLGLARLQRPEAVTPVVALLAEPDADCRFGALQMLESLGPLIRPAVPRLLDLLGVGRWDDWESIARLLGQAGDSSAIPALRRVLRQPSWRVQLAAAKALESFSSEASSAAPELATLAAEHYSAEVRRVAATAATRVAGRSVVPKPLRCTARLERSGSDYVATTASGRIRLRPVAQLPLARPASGPCASVSANEHIKVLVAESEACVIGESEGEFGGRLSVFEDGKQRLLREEVNPLRSVRAAGQLLVLEGLSHMSLSRGSILRVERNFGGHLQVVPVAELPGAPLAFGLDAQQRLVVLTRDDAGVGRCATGAPGSLLRVTHEGRLEAVE